MKGIRDLAGHLGLTVGTVSRALNDRPEVSPETRRRVREAAFEIGYVPNQSGRALRKGATNAIGFMVESGAAYSNGGDNFFSGVMAGLQPVLLRHRLDLVMLPCASAEDPDAFLRRMVSRRFVDGVIISATRRADPRVGFLVRAGVPFVALGRSAATPDHAWIDLDFEGVAADAVDRLARTGHRRIAIALPADESNLGYVFRDNFAAALGRNGLAFDPMLVFRVPVSEAGGVDLAERLLALETPATAVVLINELLAIGLYHRLARAGLVPGRDLAVIGFRENPQVRFLQPRLACYALSLADLGARLGETLLSRMPAFAETDPAAQATPGLIWPMLYAPGESAGGGRDP